MTNEVVDKSWQELAREAQLEREEFRCKVIEQSAAIEQLHAAVKTAQELAATRLMEIHGAHHDIDRLMAACNAEANEVERLRKFIEKRCVGAGPGADAERWRLIDEWRKVKAIPHEPSEQRPADGTRDGDGVWQGGFWHPDLPDPLDEWLQMEFAPKDGTRILALVTEVQFYRDTATPNELIPVVVRWTGEYSGWSMPGHGGLRPTLWLPIKLTNDPQTSDEIRDLACCDKFVRESASEFCATCGYTNLDHLRKRSSLRT